jgi:hypothetical protein
MNTKDKHDVTSWVATFLICLAVTMAPPAVAAEPPPSLPHIVILATGGTIAGTAQSKNRDKRTIRRVSLT